MVLPFLLTTKMMPFLPQHSPKQGISLPPSGWVLAVLLVAYIFIGLIGHDPWKSDDAIAIGLAYDIVKNGNWLFLQLAGQLHPDAPLYYWVAAATAHLFSWLLPLHDAARLASGMFTLLALISTLLAAREWHGREHAAAGPLILAGSIGFLFHAHEAQPMLAALSAHSAAYWALACLTRRPVYAAVILGAALALAFLADGLLPLVTIFPALIWAAYFANERAKCVLYLLLAVSLAFALCGAWLLALWWYEPSYLGAFFQKELASLSKLTSSLSNILQYLGALLWYAWPALPMAVWTLWSKRRFLGSKALALPALSFICVLLILGICVEQRSAPALLLLPPLVLLAVPGVASLRRGAANAFDWFGMMTFSLFAVVAWIGWSAIALGWPARLAQRAVHLEPGFVGYFAWEPALFSLAATLAWVWLIMTSPRSPLRGIMHWMAGLTLFWLLVALLWMPWVDYGKTYRPFSAALAKTIASQPSCMINVNLSDAVLASLDYFNQIRLLPVALQASDAQTQAQKNCRWLLIQGESKEVAAQVKTGWQKVWQGKRPGDRRARDQFHLYQRVGQGTTG